MFAVAETGRMHHRRATTSWFLGPEFLKRYPTVALDLDTMVVVDGNLVTAGAAFAHIDLALSLVRSISPDLAQYVAKLLIIDERPSQAAFVAYEHLRHEDPIVVEFERFVRARLDEPFNVAFVAQSLGTSRRTLERRVRAALNLTPLGFVQRLRIERARTSQQPRTSPPPRSRYGSATRTPRLCAPSCAGSDAVPDLSPCL